MIKRSIRLGSRHWMFTLYNHAGLNEVLDQDFDAENDNYRPTADTLDHIQPHYRVTLPA
jgi:hypothetical protein